MYSTGWSADQVSRSVAYATFAAKIGYSLQITEENKQTRSKLLAEWEYHDHKSS
jgi:hypothetical protein